MSTAAHADHGSHGDHHHKETFISKYVFSMDHKMIAPSIFDNGNYNGLYWCFPFRSF